MNPDNLTAWADLYCPAPEPIKPAPAFDQGTEDDPYGFLAQEEPQPVRCLDPEAQAQRILAQVPNADPAYVQALTARSSPEFIDALLGPMSKRARFVRDLLLQHGSTTAAEIMQEYAHQTAAVNDLAQVGVPLITVTVQAPNGRPTTRYALDPDTFETRKEHREGIPARVREAVLDAAQGACTLCPLVIDKRVLQVDHRVPLARVGNSLARSEGLAAFQALCPSCNTAKRQACQRCPTKDPQECRSCWWAYPEKYTHIAGRHERRLTVVATTPDEFPALDALRAEAARLGLPCL